MTALAWNDTAPRYEYGADRAVLYLRSGLAVAWPGLVSVDEQVDGGDVSSYYVDGEKYLDYVENRNFKASIEVVSFPDAFGPCAGVRAAAPGLFLTGQNRDLFDFTYRTMVGDELGYKIHLVYNVLADVQSMEYTTLSEDVDLQPRTFEINATPVDSKIFKPTAHYVLDSTDIPADILGEFERLLYGTADLEPSMPPFDRLALLASNWNPRKILANYVTGISPSIPGIVDVTERETDGLFTRLSTSRLTPMALEGLYKIQE